jgi:preprotein translocase subunit SecG
MTLLTSYVVPVIHVLACLFLIVVVLLQTGKGADMGAVFGGGSQTLFGSGGAGNFLTRLTTGTAIAFMITSLILTWGASRPHTSTLLNKVPTAEAPAAAPEQAAEAPAEAEGGGAAEDQGAADERAAPSAPAEAPTAPSAPAQP